MRGLIWSCIFVLFFGIIMVIIFPSKIVVTIVAAIGAVIMSVFIVFDTQMIMGGKRYELSLDEYIIGVLLLYTVRTNTPVV